ncbi:hypothetical protein BGY98DRAFT_971051 [Russula aff. rugulosa BPL654]|nr:hypothetical protein BGY98DRAFT_971051 [Russula aff. rugulosa BPL654]
MAASRHVLERFVPSTVFVLTIISTEAAHTVYPLSLHSFLQHLRGRHCHRYCASARFLQPPSRQSLNRGTIRTAGHSYCKSFKLA